MKTKFIPFAKPTATDFSAETPFNVRFKDEKGAVTVTFSAVFNQFGQLLNAETRRIIDPLPAEMEVSDDPAPATAKP